jgi:hypothetical protein
MPLKYKLQTWRLHATKPHDSKKHAKPRLIWSGFAVLSDSASDLYCARSNGGQEMTTYFNLLKPIGNFPYDQV